MKRFKSVVYVGLVMSLLLLTAAGVMADEGESVLAGGLVWAGVVLGQKRAAGQRD